ncbi:MAG: hypothetical protein OXP71_07710 [Candidatus Poribacteria bacterium]|nr:hypothetical protein [Candidatus Poribacteria bacterium]
MVRQIVRVPVLIFKKRGYLALFLINVVLVVAIIENRDAGSLGQAILNGFLNVLESFLAIIVFVLVVAFLLVVGIVGRADKGGDKPQSGTLKSAKGSALKKKVGSSITRK